MYEGFATLSRRFVAKAILLNKFDLMFIFFVVILAAHYHFNISKMAFPVWDGAVYLQNAQDWLRHEPLTASYRPQLISWIIAGVWSVTGEEDWTAAKYIQALFTITAGVILYLTLRKRKGSPFALGVTGLTMLNSYVFFYSTQILTEGLSLFFLVLSLYFLKSEEKKYSGVLAGVVMALTFASRYPIFLQAFSLLIVEVVTRRDARLLMKALAGLVPMLVLIVAIVYVKAGDFSVAISSDTEFTLLLSPFYLENFIAIFGIASLLAPVALLFKRTYADKYNYAFIVWFVVAFLFWSAISGNQQERFMIQVMPAIYFLAILAIENIWRSNLFSRSALSSFKRSVSRRLE
jgi:hypothetical protein